MSLVTEIAEYYQHHVEIGELEPQAVPGPTEIAAEWEVSESTARRVRSALIRAGLATLISAPTVPLGSISDTDMDDRFWPKVLPKNSDGCMLWDASTRDGSYGQFKVNGRHAYAHRVAWEYKFGPLPQGFELDHVWSRGCRSQLCVNTDHLEPVTKEENQRRDRAARRWRAGIWVRTELDED